MKCDHPIAPEIGPEIEMPYGAVDDLRMLKLKQRQVLELIIAGAGISEAARLSAVSRITVHRWIREDPDFAGALREWRHRMHESARAKLASAVDGAANVLLNRLRQGDVRAALAILRSNGLMAGKAESQSTPPPAPAPEREDE